MRGVSITASFRDDQSHCVTVMLLCSTDAVLFCSLMMKYAGSSEKKHYTGSQVRCPFEQPPRFCVPIIWAFRPNAVICEILSTRVQDMKRKLGDKQGKQAATQAYWKRGHGVLLHRTPALSLT
jgi:hypothetical protein